MDRRCAACWTAETDDMPYEPEPGPEWDIWAQRGKDPECPFHDAKVELLPQTAYRVTFEFVLADTIPADFVESVVMNEADSFIGSIVYGLNLTRDDVRGNLFFERGLVGRKVRESGLEIN